MSTRPEASVPVQILEGLLLWIYSHEFESVFVVVLFTFFGVTYLLPGLHAYA